MSLENQGYQVEKENKAFEQIKELSCNLPNLPNHLPLWDVDSWSWSLNFGLVSLVERKGLRSGDSSGTWKRQEFDFPAVLFRGSFGISRSFASSICYRKRNHILPTPNSTSKWRSGKLTKYTSQNKWSIK